MIIGISGRIGSGKDTFAKYIQELAPSFEVKKFAGKLKQIASLLTGVPIEKFEDQEFKKQTMGSDWYTEIMARPLTYREFLQKLGTEAMRDNLHSNIWVNALFADYKKDFRCLTCGYPSKGPVCDASEAYPNWLITDVRFPNEANAIRDRGGVIVRLRRNEDKLVEGLHVSETALDNYPFDWVVNNNRDLEYLKNETEVFIDVQRASFPITI
jgi:hypothetical protein